MKYYGNDQLIPGSLSHTLEPKYGDLQKLNMPTGGKMDFNTKVEFLKQYQKYKKQVEIIEDEITEWQSKAEKITASYSFAPGGGGGESKIAIAIEKIDTLRNKKLTPRLVGQIALREYIQDAIKNIEDSNLYDVLHLVYIEGMTHEKAALKLAKDRATIWRWHRVAIDDIDINVDDYKMRLQSALEALALNKNDGECQTYPYCARCEEPESIIRESKTPCADAYLKYFEKAQKCNSMQH